MITNILQLFEGKTLTQHDNQQEHQIYVQFSSRSSFLTCLPKVVQAVLVDREEADSGSVLWTHVGDSGSVGNRQGCHSRAKKLHKLSHNSDLPQVLQNAKELLVFLFHLLFLKNKF